MTKDKFNELLDKIRIGETNSLEELFNEYWVPMKYAALLKIKDVKGAEDIAANLFVYILENINYIDYIEYPTAWMRTIIHRRAVDYLRKDSKSVMVDSSNDNFVTEDISEINQIYFEMLKDLSSYEQELVELHYLHGLKYKEISKIKTKSVAAIKIDIFRIKKKLQPFLKNFIAVIC